MGQPRTAARQQLAPQVPMADRHGKRALCCGTLRSAWHALLTRARQSFLLPQVHLAAVGAAGDSAGAQAAVQDQRAGAAGAPELLWRLFQLNSRAELNCND